MRLWTLEAEWLERAFRGGNVVLTFGCGMRMRDDPTYRRFLPRSVVPKFLAPVHSVEF